MPVLERIYKLKISSIYIYIYHTEVNICAAADTQVIIIIFCPG